jgi:hypothetical protein
MADLERKLDTLIDKLDKLYSTGGRTNVPPPTGSTSLGDKAGDFFSTLGKGVGNVFDTTQGLLGKAQANTATAQDVATAVAKTVNQLTADIPGLSAFGKIFEGMTGVLTESVANWQQFSGVGLQFGGDAIALNTAIKRTGMTVDQFAGQWEKLGPAIYNLGLGVTSGTKAYSELSARMLEPAYADQFNKLGMNVKDTNAALATVMRSAQGIVDMNKLDSEGKNALLENTLRLSKEFDMVAKMTGKTREEQQKQVEALQADARVNARILLNREQNPAANEDIGRAQVLASRLDPETAKLVNEGIAGKGIFTTDAITQFRQIFGPEAATRMSQITRDINSTDAKTRETALRNLENINVQLMQSRKFGALQTAGGATEDNKFAQSAYGGINNQYEIQRKVIESIRKEAGNENMSIEAANAQAQLRIDKLEQRGKKMEMKDGKIVEVDIVGAQITSAVTGVETNIKRFGVGLNELIENMTTQLGKIKGKDGTTVAAKLEAGSNMAISPTKSATTEMMNSINTAIDKMTKIPETYGDKIGDKILEKIKEMIPSRESGTLGKTGQYFENFGSGTLAMLHANEGVIRADQADAFAMSRMNGIMPNLSKVMQKATATVSDSSGGADQVADAISRLTTSNMPDFSNLGTGIDKLNSTFESLGPVLQQIARNTGDAATNTKDIGNYIS